MFSVIVILMTVYCVSIAPVKQGFTIHYWTLLDKAIKHIYHIIKHTEHIKTVTYKKHIGKSSSLYYSVIQYCIYIRVFLLASHILTASHPYAYSWASCAHAVPTGRIKSYQAVYAYIYSINLASLLIVHKIYLMQEGCRQCSPSARCYSGNKLLILQHCLFTLRWLDLCFVVVNTALLLHVSGSICTAVWLYFISALIHQWLMYWLCLCIRIKQELMWKSSFCGFYFSRAGEALC